MSDGGGSAASVDNDDGWRRVQRARSLDPLEQEEADADNAAVHFDQLELGGHLLDMFDDHCNHMQRLASARQALLGLRLVTHQDGNQATDGAIAGECVSFVRLPSDRFIGDARLRCVRALLAEVDERGFERFAGPRPAPRAAPFLCQGLSALSEPPPVCVSNRSNHQERFHDAFMRSCGRVLYREEWSVHRKAIMTRNGWDRCPGEIMISTPRCAARSAAPRPCPVPGLAPTATRLGARRRFGKTFACAARPTRTRARALYAPCAPSAGVGGGAGGGGGGGSEAGFFFFCLGRGGHAGRFGGDMRLRCSAVFHCSRDARPPLNRLLEAARSGMGRARASASRPRARAAPPPLNSAPARAGSPCSSP